MANIPNKADGQVLYARELFKVGGSDQTGTSGHEGTTTETTMASIALSASQLSQGAFVVAAIGLAIDDLNLAPSGQTATFRLKRNGSTIITKVLNIPNFGTLSGAGGRLFVGHPLLYLDTAATFTSAVTYTITCELSSTSTAYSAECTEFYVLGV